MSLEDFRNLIKGFIISLNRDSTQYKIAKRYGLVLEVTEPEVIFYFEKQPNKSKYNCDDCKFYPCTNDRFQLKTKYGICGDHSERGTL